MAAALDQAVFGQIFHNARTFNHFSTMKVDDEVKVSMIANIGYQGNLDTVKPRAYRFSLEEVAQLL